jgi:uncharacterized protein YndB with AHSA1/START domain
MTRDLLFETIYPVPPERVWQALTDSRALAEWLMENDFAPRVGHSFTFRTPPRPGFDGIVRCTVLELDPPRRLAYSWLGGPLKRPTTVTWTLAAVPEGTRLRLEHTGFAGASGFVVSALLGRGWRGLVEHELREWLIGERRTSPRCQG